MTEPQWTRKTEGVLCLHGAPVEIRLDERQWFRIWALNKEHSIAATLDSAKRVGERIAKELQEIGAF